MAKLALVALLMFAGVTAQAGLVEIKCKPNAEAKISQFVVFASLAKADDDSLSGTVQYATRSSTTAQTSEVITIKVKGRLVVIPAGELATHAIESYQLVDEDDSLVRLILNPDLDGPLSSTLIIDRKDRYSSNCKLAN